MRRVWMTIGALLASLAAAHAEAPSQQGRWLTASGNLEIEIAPCGPALCGTVARFIANNAMVDGGPAADKPPAIGLKILSDFTAGADGVWHGHIFNRQNGQTYECLLMQTARDELTVTPYVGTPANGRPQVWKRVAAQR